MLKTNVRRAFGTLFAGKRVEHKIKTAMEENKNIQEEEIKQDAEKTAEEAAAQAENSENTENSENVENTENAEASEKDPLEEANRQIEELKDKYLRSVAEFDNYRKRTLKEKAELILNGGEKAITAMLPVIDDMERAIENGGKTVCSIKIIIHCSNKLLSARINAIKY